MYLFWEEGQTVASFLAVNLAEKYIQGKDKKGQLVAETGENKESNLVVFPAKFTAKKDATVWPSSQNKYIDNLIQEQSNSSKNNSATKVSSLTDSMSDVPKVEVTNNETNQDKANLKTEEVTADHK
jgi:hypothetical protein